MTLHYFFWYIHSLPEDSWCHNCPVPVHTCALSTSDITFVLPHNHVLCAIFLFITFSDISCTSHTVTICHWSISFKFYTNLYLAGVRLGIKIQERLEVTWICIITLTHMLKCSYTPVDPQPHSPAADTVLWCCSPAILGCQPLRTHLLAAHARICVAAMTEVFDVLLSASTQSHVAV